MLRKLTLAAVMFALLALPVIGFAGNTATGGTDAKAAATAQAYQLKVGGMT
jgi:hypothetical protein